jgi:hypothetical protein
MAFAKATPEAPHPRHAYGSMLDSAYQAYQTDFQWDGAHPDWAGEASYVGGPSDKAAILTNDTYLMTVYGQYHLSLPVPGDYNLTLGAQLRGAAGSTTQVIGLGGDVQAKVTAPPGTTHAARFETDLTIYIPSVIVKLGQQWYGDALDINCPAGLAIGLGMSYDYDTMRPQFLFSDEDTLVTHDGWNYWSVERLRDIIGAAATPTGEISGSTPRSKSVRVGG